MSTGTQGQNTVKGSKPYGEFDPNMGYGQDTPFNQSPVGQTQNGGLLSGMPQVKAAPEQVTQGPYPEQNPMGGNALPEYTPPNDQGIGVSGLGLGGYGSNQPQQASQNSYNFQYGPSAYTPNPYLEEQVGNITRGFNRNLQEQVLPGLRSKFIGSGGLGGSRQGIAEGLAAARSGEGLSSAITNLYASDYENSQNRSLQGSIAGMNAGLSARNMDLQDQMNRLNSERGFYTSQRGQDLQQLGLAAGLLGQANQGFMGQGQGIYGIGQQEQNAPWQQLQNYSGLLAPYQQAGATNSQGQQYSYNPTMQYIGGNMQAAASILPMLSDVRLKENIKRVGKTDDGLGVYTYNYKWDDTPQMGVMAQEVEKKKPEAMGPTVGGYKSVRYGLLG